jgi:hypothetical protein
MAIAPQDLPKTRAEAIAKAYSWLDKAILMEQGDPSQIPPKAPSSAGMVSRALDRAVEFENYAFTLPA